MKSILVPISFSDHSKNSLKHANRIAQETGATLTLLHCYSPQSYNHAYTFEFGDYDQGIRNMLNKFYRDHIDKANARPFKILAVADSISTVIGNISGNYDLLVMSRKTDFQSRSDEWFSDRLLYLKKKSSCPVHLLSNTDKSFSLVNSKNIWHIQRKESDIKLIQSAFPNIDITPDSILTKSFEQKSFSSIFWQSIVRYRKNHMLSTFEKVKQSMKDEKIDLLTIVYHKPSAIDQLLQEDPFQILSQINIPLLVMPAR